MIGGGPFRLFVAPGNALLAAAGARRGVGVGLGGQPPPMSNMVSCCRSVAVGSVVGRTLPHCRVLPKTGSCQAAAKRGLAELGRI